MAALQAWTHGLPPDPAAWRLEWPKTARATCFGAARCVEATARSSSTPRSSPSSQRRDPDEDLLAIMFCCCHPRLTDDTQTMLILRLVCGFGTGEVALAFFWIQARWRSASCGRRRSSPMRVGSSMRRAWPNARAQSCRDASNLPHVRRWLPQRRGARGGAPRHRRRGHPLGGAARGVTLDDRSGCARPRRAHLLARRATPRTAFGEHSSPARRAGPNELGRLAPRAWNGRLAASASGSELAALHLGRHRRPACDGLVRRDDRLGRDRGCTTCSTLGSQRPW